MCITWADDLWMMGTVRAGLVEACECPRGTWDAATLAYVRRKMHSWTYNGRLLRAWMIRSHATSTNGLYPPGHSFRVQVVTLAEFGNSTSPRLDLAIEQALRILEVRLSE